MKRPIGYIVLIIALLGPSTAALAQQREGQAPPSPPTPQPARPPNSPVKLQIVLSKYQGDKRISSQPYTMLLATGIGGTLAVGADVAVPTGADAGSSFQFQRVGTDISATVNPLTESTYILSLSVNDRSHFINLQPEPGREKLAGIPSFRSMSTAGRAVLSPGETAQFLSALDPASNETLRIEVTLTLGNK